MTNNIRKSITIAFLILSTVVLQSNISKATLTNNTFYVGGSGPGNFTAIQDAINAGDDGDRIYIYNGTYYENVKVRNHHTRLIGESAENTIIDGGGIEDVVSLIGDNITISGFTIQNSGKDHENSGIKISSDFNNISENIIKDNGFYGVFSSHTSNNIISNNIIRNNTYGGIKLRYSSKSGSIM